MTWFLVLIASGGTSPALTVLPHAYPTEEACIVAFTRRSNREDRMVDNNLRFTCIAGLEKKREQ